MNAPHNYVAVRLREALPGLSTAEQRVARVFLAAGDDLDHLTVTACAARAQTSTATVVRLFQRLGYPRYKGFVVDLATDLRRHDGAESLSGDIVAGDSLAEVIAKVHTDEAISMADTVQTLDRSAVGRAVALLSAAARIDLFGAGGSAIGGHDLQQKLSRIGRTALSWPDRHSAWTAAATLGRSAVALGISHSGETDDTVRFLSLARTRGAATIALTNHGGSAIAAQADVVLLTAAREAPFRSGALGSRMAQLLVLDILFVAVAQSSYERSMAHLQQTLAAVRGPAPPLR